MAATAPIPGSSARLPQDSLPRVPVREMVPLDSLVEDAGTQVRSTIDDGVVDDYAEALATDVRFPPIIVVRGDKGDILADGFHQAAAYRKAGRSEIEADVHHGTVEDAMWLAVGANRAHGQRLSNTDKRRAIEMAYRAWPDLSQRRIAAQAGCSQAYVSKTRSELNRSHQLPDTVISTDGKRHPATRETSPSPTRSAPPPATPAAASPPTSEAEEPEPPTEAAEMRKPPAPAMAARPQAERTAPRKPTVEATEDGETTPEPTAAEPAERAARGTTARQSAQKRSNRIVSVIAYDAKNSTVQQDLIDFTALDFDQVPGWIEDIDEGAANLRKLSKRLGEEWKKNAAARAPVEN